MVPVHISKKVTQMLLFFWYNVVMNVCGGAGMKLLIIEDEETMQKILCKGFRKLNYVVDSAYDGNEALDLYFSNTYDLIVLDLNLPKLDGMGVLNEIRSDNKEIPILILSARSNVEDKIAGLDEGANDYISKPFHFGELEARVRALLRRNFKTSDTVIKIRSTRIDMAAKRFYVNEEEIILSKKEYGILEYLFLRKGEVISSMELIGSIWDSDAEDSFNAFKVRLSALRKKLPDNLIKTVRGQGYYVE
jgi:DNA-binding response OmpR family regulator